MHQHVHAELVGGPEDGRSFVLPAVEADMPVDRFTLPAPRESAAPCARYALSDRRADGGWRYRYAGEKPLATS